LRRRNKYLTRHPERSRGIWLYEEIPPLRFAPVGMTQGKKMTNLNDLNTRLNAAKARQEAQNPSEPPKYSREMNLGIRAFMEMLGVLLGSGLMGWALDAYFKTSPTLLITFVILGIIAAFFNLYKLSKNLGTAIGSPPHRHPGESRDP